MDKFGAMLLLIGGLGLIISFFPGVVDTKHAALRTILLATACVGWLLRALSPQEPQPSVVEVARTAYVKATEDTALNLVPKDWTVLRRSRLDDRVICEARTYLDRSPEFLIATLLQSEMGHSYELSSGADFDLKKQVTFWKDASFVQPRDGIEVPPASAAATLISQCVAALKSAEALRNASTAVPVYAPLPPAPYPRVSQGKLDGTYQARLPEK